ncbi:hypothetical protein AAHC03_013570 [Spirometra sp. Aus1]
MRSPSLKSLKRPTAANGVVQNPPKYRSRSVSQNLRSRSSLVGNGEELSTPSSLTNNHADFVGDFKVPESPTTRLSKLRISLRSSANKTRDTSSLVASEGNRVPVNEIKQKDGRLRSPLNAPSPRTPRRACKDDAMSKILLCFEKLSTECEGPTVSRRYTVQRTPQKQATTPRNLRKASPYADTKSPSDSNFCPSDDSFASSSYSSESSYSESSSTSSFSEDDSSDDWAKRKPHSRRPTQLNRKPPFSTPNEVTVPKRAAGDTVDEKSIAVKLQKSLFSECLPCREREFDAVFEFLIERLQTRTGGCLYISGVPGTGKTATVTAVLNAMTSTSKESSDNAIPPFTVVSINGMQVSEPRQAYVQIYEQLTGTRVSVNRAVTLLEAEFCAPTRVKQTTKRLGEMPACVLVIDELDLLCSKRQDVLYSLFDWPCRQVGRRLLIVLAIANTMDLPERLLHHRVASRLGLNRLPFAPYSHEQLAEIVRSRLGPALSSSFAPKAIELAARKVAAVSGDARRALDICRRAAELAQLEVSKRGLDGNQTGELVTMTHINAALKEMFSSLKLTALRSLSRYEKLLLRAIVSEASARSAEEVRLDRCIEQAYALCTLEGLPRPTDTEIFAMCASLGAYKLIFTEPSRRDTCMLIRLNCSQADVLFALKNEEQ